jgi:hypothetical protein
MIPMEYFNLWTCKSNSILKFFIQNWEMRFLDGWTNSVYIRRPIIIIITLLQ